MIEAGTMKVTALTEHEDGSATCTFDLDDKTAALSPRVRAEATNILWCHWNKHRLCVQ